MNIIDALTPLHREMLLRCVLAALFVVQFVLWLVSGITRYTKNLSTKRKIKRKERQKEKRKQAHAKTIESQDSTEENKFAGLTKPKGESQSDLLGEKSLTKKEVVDGVTPVAYAGSEHESHQEEIIVESVTIIEDETPAEDHSKTKESKAKKQALVEQIQEQEEKAKIQKIRNEALRVKEKGQIDIYEKKLIEGLAMDPKNTEFLTLLADHYFATNHYKRALTLLKRLLDQDKINHRAMRQMGEIYLSHGDAKTAEIMIEQAIKHQKNNPKYLYSLVDIKYNSDKVDDAIYLMERIIKLRPANIEYLIATAMLYEKSGDNKTAKKYYQTILGYDPENTTAKRKLQEL